MQMTLPGQPDRLNTEKTNNWFHADSNALVPYSMTSQPSSRTKARSQDGPRKLVLSWAQGDPQGLDAFVHSWRIREALLINHERLAQRTLARIALRFSTGVLTELSDQLMVELLECISSEIIDEDLPRSRRSAGTPGNAESLDAHAGVDEFLCRELALPPEQCLGARVRFNALPRTTRKAFFALLHPKDLRLPLPGAGPPELDDLDPDSFSLVLDAFKALFDAEDSTP